MACRGYGVLIDVTTTTLARRRDPRNHGVGIGRIGTTSTFPYAIDAASPRCRGGVDFSSKIYSAPSSTRSSSTTTSGSSSEDIASAGGLPPGPNWSRSQANTDSAIDGGGALSGQLS